MSENTDRILAYRLSERTGKAYDAAIEATRRREEQRKLLVLDMTTAVRKRKEAYALMSDQEKAAFNNDLLSSGM